MPAALPLESHYGLWTVIRRVHHGVHLRCVCGKEIISKVQTVRSGASKSCGCNGGIRRIRKLQPDHKRPEYGPWSEIKRRCFDPRRPAFKDYGGRGISVCEQWLRGAGGLNGFQTFLRDMGPRPAGRYSIERLDNNGDYEPFNCYWATQKEQARNTRGNRLISYKNETLCLAEMCEKHGKDVDLVWGRIHVLGWTVKAAMESPKIGHGYRHQ